jgi:hypothetical protein
MRRAVVLAIIALLALPLAGAAQTKWVRGEVTAVSGNSLTVKTAEGSMTFMFDESTDVVAPGGGTATREAQKAGKQGATLAQIIKVGDGVEVHYRDMAGKLHATEIRGGVSAAPAAPVEPKKGSSASGTVTAVSASSITVKGKDAEWTFAIDPKTVVVGRGLGTAARELQKAGTPATITQFIKQNDEVTVRFTDKHADEIRVIRSAK